MVCSAQCSNQSGHAVVILHGLYPTTLAQVVCMCLLHRSGTPTAHGCSSYCNKLLTSNSPHILMCFSKSFDNSRFSFIVFTCFKPGTLYACPQMIRCILSRLLTTVFVKEAYIHLTISFPYSYTKPTACLFHLLVGYFECMTGGFNRWWC